MYNFFKTSDKEFFDTKINDIYFKSIKQVQITDEYKQNKLKIYTLRKALIENCDVPEKLVDSLIESVAENTALEYESANQKINKYIN